MKPFVIHSEKIQKKEECKLEPEDSDLDPEFLKAVEESMREQSEKLESSIKI